MPALVLKRNCTNGFGLSPEGYAKNLRRKVQRKRRKSLILPCSWSRLQLFRTYLSAH